jgi:membrane-bound lytic murein transglycosylase B
MSLSLFPRWQPRQLIAASSLILLVACAEKPTAADAVPLAPAQPAPVVTLPTSNADINAEIQPVQSFARFPSTSVAGRH